MASGRRLRMTSSTHSRSSAGSRRRSPVAGVDDAHVHAGLDGVVKEHRMDRLAHRVVAAKREGDVGDAAGDQRPGSGLCLDPRVASMKSTA